MNSSLRILQLVPKSLLTYRPDIATLFGKYLPRFGVTCDLVGGRDGEPPVPCPGFASRKRIPQSGVRLRSELHFAMACVRAVLGADNGCAAVQVRDMSAVAVLVMLAARLRGLPFLYWMSFPMGDERIRRGRAGSGLRSRILLARGIVDKWLLFRLVLPRTDHVFVQSDKMAEMMRIAGVAEDRITAVPMGVDTELFASYDVPCGTQDSPPVIAYLGKVERVRELEVVIDALQLVRQRHPTARLRLIGSRTAADMARLRGHAAGLNMEDAVEIIAWQPPDVARGLLRGAALAVSFVPRGPLFDISSPTKVLEYLALAIPTVANDIPDQAWVLRSSDAGWVTGSSPAELAAAICEILDDPSAARVRAMRGPPFIEQERSYRVLAERLARQYRTILSSPAETPTV